MNYTFGKIILIFFFSLFFVKESFSQDKSLFDSSGDVGTNVKPGSTTFIPATGQYIISGAGYNVWADHDEFQYTWKKMRGDFIVYARAEFLGTWVNYHRKVGWMVRKSLAGNSAQVNAVEHGDGLTSLQWRPSAGAQTLEHRLKLTHANILQLERKGNLYIMRAAVYGDTFQTDTLSGVDLGDEVYVGLFVGSHNGQSLCYQIQTNLVHCHHNRSVPPHAICFRSCPTVPTGK